MQINQEIEQNLGENLSVNAEWLLGEQIEGQIWTQHALKPL